MVRKTSQSIAKKPQQHMIDTALGNPGSRFSLLTQEGDGDETNPSVDGDNEAKPLASAAKATVRLPCLMLVSPATVCHRGVRCFAACHEGPKIRQEDAEGHGKEGNA